MTNSLNNLKFSSRVTVLSLIFVLPLAVNLWFFIVEKVTLISVSGQELSAIEFLRPVHRLLANVDRLSEMPNTARDDFAGLLADRKNLAEQLAVDDQLRRLAATPPAGLAADPNSVARGLESVISRVDQGSGLSLDSGRDTYYLIETIVAQLPTMALRVVELRHRKPSAAFGAGSDDGWTERALFAGGIVQANRRFCERVGRSIASLDDPVIAARLRWLSQEFEMTDRLLVAAVLKRDEVALKTSLDLTDRDIGAAFDTMDDTVVTLLARRIERETGILLERLTILGIMVLGGGLFALTTALSIRRPVEAMTRALSRLAAGEVAAGPLVDACPNDRRDEIGRMAQALSVLRDKLIEADWAKLQRNEAVAALERGRAAFQLPFEANPLPMWIYDRETLEILEVNCAAVDAYGWSREAFLRMTLYDLRPEEELDRVGEAALVRAGERQSTGPWTHLKADGSRCTVQIISHAIPFGGREAVLVAPIDITEIHRLQEQLLQARKMEAVGQLAGGIAHDFNNILGSIIGFSGFLLEDLPAGSAQHGFASRILAAGERGRDLVKQILAFSRVESVERKPTNLAKVVREGHELLRGSIPSSIGISLTIEADNLVASVNATQISQILINLCVNAKDALLDESGRISIWLSSVLAEGGQVPVVQRLDQPGDAESPEARIQLGVFQSTGHYARLSVADTGCGMTQQQLERIFEPFFTTKTRGQGTGLGLSIVHNIVSGYDGVAVVRSRPGHGSTFEIYLPLSAEAASSAEVPAICAGGSESILVVDDEVMITEMLHVGLGRLGYRVTTVNDPVEAVERFRATPDAWDVVISDQVMPILKGTGLFSAVRELNPNIRFILCTGFSDESTKSSSLGIGIDAFFHKPVTPQLLAETIRYLLDRQTTQP
jgi:PAS domain S-box-containing protein